MAPSALRSSALRTPVPPSPPWAGPIHLGPRGGLPASSLLRQITIQQLEHVCIDAQLPTPRAVAAGAGWMNADQPDKLSEAAARVFVRPAFICPAQGTLRSRARRQGIHVLGGPAPWTSKGPGGVQGQQAPRLCFGWNTEVGAVGTRRESQTGGVSPPLGDVLFAGDKSTQKRLAPAVGMALSTGRRLRSSLLPGRTPVPPSPPWAGPIHLGPRGGLPASSLLRQITIQQLEHAIARSAPRAVAPETEPETSLP